MFPIRLQWQESQHQNGVLLQAKPLPTQQRDKPQQQPYVCSLVGIQLDVSQERPALMHRTLMAAVQALIHNLPTVVLQILDVIGERCASRRLEEVVSVLNYQAALTVVISNHRNAQ